MSIALWKSILALAKTGAVVAILASGFLFYDQRREMAKPWSVPDFLPEARPLVGGPSEVTSLMIPLGRFQRARPVNQEQKPEEKQPDLTTELGKLGDITNGFIVPPPYEERGLAPTIVWQWKPGQRPANDPDDTRVLRLGDALYNKQHPGHKNKEVPVRYKFIACEHDSERPGWTWFVFDVNCDGKNIQRAHWKLVEEPEKKEKPSEADVEGAGPVSTANIYIGDPLSSDKPPPPEETKPEVKVEDAPPVVPEPKPIVAEQDAETPDSLFQQEEDGAFATTQDGMDYLQKNYEKILEGTRTETYRGSDGRTGIRITGISNQSLATQFGIMRDDVVISINGVSVDSQSGAVKVVKDQLKQKARYITVVVKRRGREITKKYDTRDPATRRAAQKGGYK